MLTLVTKFGMLKILNRDTIVDTLSVSETSPGAQTFHFVNAYSLVLANSNINLYRAYSAGFCFCDSRILEIYSKIVSSPIRQIRGSDFLKNFLSNRQTELQFFITGGNYSREDISSKVSAINGTDILVSSFQPSFSSNIDLIADQVAHELAVQRPKYVWIGIGTPKQDILAKKLIEIFPSNYFCVGAALNFLMGEISECPPWISKIGMEWFFRLTQEPSRLWRRYLLGNINFIWFLLVDFKHRLHLIRSSSYSNFR